MSETMSTIDSASSQGYYSWTTTLKGVYYGPGSVSTALPKLLNAIGVNKALVVTGKSLHDKVNFSIAMLAVNLTHRIEKHRPRL